ncbi:sigma-70 family RNA polymerase sigma factor [Joostella atrarenae]|uniref:Sigma-70 family RNA polymerase sigma factor n=1 Tax=Joostella atrarenae TaxID=679257 RepID=A0ABS9J5D8_9FLAO|nr:sigma-70 family RNA polymerase sigma factor [Joostella atrarenae]MCF8715642.1 sigma-70 family RNA polymerase sigma factor [Joostella atrarenae]
MDRSQVDDNIDDETLVAKIVATNNTHLFAILYDRYSHVVYNKCLSFTHASEEAQDLTHDIFIHLFLKLKTYKGNAKFSTWLYSFTYNFCVNYVQRNMNKRNKKFILTDEIPTNTENYEEIDDENIYQMKSDNLNLALKEMEPNDKMILLMRYQDDLSIKEIQDLLEIGASAVKMRLNRAKGRLIEIYNNL